MPESAVRHPCDAVRHATPPRFSIGDRVRLWKPRHAEHGAYGAVEAVQRYDGPPDRGPWAYRVTWTWADGKGPRFVATLPDCMVIAALAEDMIDDR